jgi:splicing factor 3B subunit 3
VLNPLSGETLQRIELEENEAAFSVATVQFATQENEQFVVVGTGKNVNLSPRSCSSGFIRTYKFIEEGTMIELIHITEVEDVPLALLAFQGRLLVGLGKSLRIMDFGRKKLLRKCENRQIPNCIVTLHTQGERIVIGDTQESVHYAVYKSQDNRIIVFADDTQPRWITATTMIDYDTIAGGDKFGNFFVGRLPTDISEEVDDDPTGSRLLYEKGYLQGAPHKNNNISHFQVGDIITSLQKSSLVSGGREILVYTTILGSIGAFIPFASQEDVDFFQTLEMHMRQEAAPLCGRDHLAFRSYYVPVKAAVDGDLCEMYNTLPLAKKQSIAEELDRTPAEVQKKLEDIRVRAAF